MFFSLLRSIIHPFLLKCIGYVVNMEMIKIETWLFRFQTMYFNEPVALNQYYMLI